MVVDFRISENHDPTFKMGLCSQIQNGLQDGPLNCLAVKGGDRFRH